MPSLLQWIVEQGDHGLGLNHEVAVVMRGVVNERDWNQREGKAGSRRYEVDLAVAEEDDHPDEGDEDEQERKDDERHPKCPDEEESELAHRQPERLERDSEVLPRGRGEDPVERQ